MQRRSRLPEGAAQAAGAAVDARRADDGGGEDPNALPSLTERVIAKLQAAVWVVLAGVAIYYGDLLAVAVDPEKANVWAMGVAAAASAVVFGVFLYLVVYLPYVARVRLEWSVYAPRAIPTATIAGTLAFLSAIVGLWPTFRLLSPLVVFTVLMGVIMGTHFVPIP